MNFEFIGRNLVITPAMKKVFEGKLLGLDKFFTSKDNNCRVVVTNEKIGQKIEVTIPTKTAILRAEVRNEDVYNGIDQIIEKLERQLRKAKTKISVQNKSSFASILNLEEIEEVEEEIGEDLVRTKSLIVTPMDLNEAIANMEMIGHDFYIYRDAEDEKISVVYRRDKKGYGLIEIENS